MNFSTRSNRMRPHAAGLLLATLTLAAGAQNPERSDHWNYTIDRQDSLIAIGKRFLKMPQDWEKLQAINNISNTKGLVPGSKLQIPVALLRSSATVATVKTENGKNAVVRDGVRIETLPVGTRLLPGDRLETGMQSTVAVEFADGSVISIAPLSKVLIENLLIYGNTGISETRLRIVEGGADSKVKPLTAAASKYIVTTPVFNLGVRGTEFRARFDPQSQTAFSEVLEGGVAAQGKTSEIVVGAGFGTRALINTEPSAPQKLPDAPKLNGFTPLATSVPARLSWQAEPGARAYRAQVFSSRAMDRQLLEGVFSEPQAVWPLIADGRYVLNVRAIDAQGLESASTAVDFSVQAHPIAPAPLTPNNSTRVYGPTVTLQWGPQTEGERVRVQVAQDAAFTQLRVDFAEARGTQFAAELPVGTYFWRTASIERNGKQGPFSSVAQFVQRPTAISPLILPAVTDNGSVIYRWEPSEPGQSFRYQLSDDSQFLSPLLDATTRNTTLQFDSPAAGTYYFRVQATDADGYVGQFSSAQVLTIQGPSPSILNRLPHIFRMFRE